MAALDKLLALFGTNRTRVTWKLRAWRNAWDRRTARVQNRAQALTYQHQTCPSCGHPAGADERTCTRCGEAMGGIAAHRARKLGALLWPAGVPVVATLLGAVIVAMYVGTILWSRQQGLPSVMASPSPLALLRFGSLFTPAVQGGEWWRLGTSMFLHVELLHIAFNLMSLWSVATYLEEVLGKTKTLALYLGLGLVSAVVSYAWHTHTGLRIGNSAGASGAICGLIGVAIGFSLRRRNVAKHMRGRYIGWAVWIVVLSFSSWNIDNAGHLGGLVPGVLAGLFVRRRRDASAASRRAWLGASITLAGLMIACVASAAATPMAEEILAPSRRID